LVFSFSLYETYAGLSVTEFHLAEVNTLWDCSGLSLQVNRFNRNEQNFKYISKFYNFILHNRTPCWISLIWRLTLCCLRIRLPNYSFDRGSIQVYGMCDKKRAKYTISEAFKGREFGKINHDTFKWFQDQTSSNLIFYLACNKKVLHIGQLRQRWYANSFEYLREIRDLLCVIYSTVILVKSIYFILGLI
jgi:hypothetical protein